MNLWLKLQRDYFKHCAYPYRASRGGAKTRKIISEDSEFFCDFIGAEGTQLVKQLQKSKPDLMVLA